MKDKGQAFMSDFAVSMALFGVILAAFFVPWNTMIESEQRFSVSDTMRTQAERTAAIMITSPGYPQNWGENTSELVIPGFSEQQDNLVSQRKLEAFQNMSYEEKRSVLNVQDFSLAFTDSDSEVLEYAGEASDNVFDQGKDISPGAETVVSVDRRVIVNKSGGFENAEMNYVVWR